MIAVFCYLPLWFVDIALFMLPCFDFVTMIHRVEAVIPTCLIRLGEAKLGLAKLGHPRLVFRVLRL